jgi:hypothetical protein
MGDLDKGFKMAIREPQNKFGWDIELIDDVVLKFTGQG